MSNVNYDLFINMLRKTPGLDVDYAIKNIGGSVFLFVKMLEKMIRMFPSYLSQMNQALNAADLNTFGIKAHGMKGSFKQICCLENANLAAALENAAKQGDTAFCTAHFKKYESSAMLFYEQIGAAMRSAGISVCADNIQAGNIQNFADLIEQAKTAAEGFDAVSASEYLAPLSEYHFDNYIDHLVLKALEEAESFRPRKAVKYITEILDSIQN